MEADVLVIGGGPAGLAAAIAAAQFGFQVEIAEPLPGAIDKCCGEGLLPTAISALEALGIPASSVAQAGFPVAGISFHIEGLQARASFKAPAFGVRRTALQALLRQRAEALGIRITLAGAKLQKGWRARLSNGEERTPVWTVVADGAQSSLRDSAMLGAERVASHRYALRQHFELGAIQQVPEFVQVHWAPGAQAYVTPVGPRRVGVAIVSSTKLTDMEAALKPFSSLRSLLHGATACSRPRGAITLHRMLQNVHRDSLALVGDASGSVDAITGDGLSLGLSQALALGEALRSGDLRIYARAHRKLMRLPGLMSRMLLLMGAHPWGTRLCMGLLARIPGLFPALLNIHTHAPALPWAREGDLPWPPVPISTRSAT